MYWDMGDHVVLEQPQLVIPKELPPAHLPGIQKQIRFLSAPTDHNCHFLLKSSNLQVNQDTHFTEIYNWGNLSYEHTTYEP